MNIDSELKKQVQLLTPSEKRYVSLIGKARSGSASQVLDLFHWLSKSGGGDEVPLPWRKNLPTLSMRLRELILDCLRMLNKESGIDAMLRARLDEVSILYARKFYKPARKLLNKTKKQALISSRYACLLQCIEIELLLVLQLPPNQVIEAMSALRQEEKEILEKHQALRELRFRHDAILALAQQYPFSRDPAITGQVSVLANAPVVAAHLNASAYIESALAVNILGMHDVFLRNPEQTIERYRNLLAAWKKNKTWQADQPDLLMLICKYYQNACLYSTVNPDELHADLLSLHEIDALPPDRLRAFRETLFHHRFILCLNTGKPEEAIALIPEIESWMKQQAAYLTEVQVLPFLCNFAVAEFMAERFQAAGKLVNRILRIHTRKARIDIRDFAIVLRPVIQYELGNPDLNEYLTRAGKRHFRKAETENNFELLILRHIEQLSETTSTSAIHKVREKFIAELIMQNRKQSSTVPLLGFNEVYMWTVARLRGVPIKTVLLDELKKAGEERAKKDV
ncbi:MAG: hypothetical protein IM638_13950 [Bacteroidetes bacterium]|nr:hypothetical protein [Bacteroidota bacterium]